MEVCLSLLLGVADALVENLLGLLDKLTVQVDGVGGNAPGGVVLPEDVLARAPVILVHQRGVFLALIAQVLGRLAIAALVRPLRLFSFKEAFASATNLHAMLKLASRSLTIRDCNRK